jgi:type II secretory pathway pseudopilin PulG
MSPASRRTRRSRGFSILEATLSLAMLIIVMLVTMSLLFTMRSFAERQQFHMAPRQTARRAIEYISDMVAAACDLNWERRDPNALMTWFIFGDPRQLASYRQSSYNNLVGDEEDLAGTRINDDMGAATNRTAFGDKGTDILTIQVPISTFRVPVAIWCGYDRAANAYYDFRVGCDGTANQDENNMIAFQNLTGYDPSTGTGGIVGLVDANGYYVYYQITRYLRSDCSAVDDPCRRNPSGTCQSNCNFKPIIHVSASPGQSDAINPPGGHPELTRPMGLNAGQRFYSFRVRTDTSVTPAVPYLEQKDGFFDPRSDNPGTDFAKIIENIEDLQVAYIYQSPPAGGSTLIYNTATDVLPGDIADPDTGAGGRRLLLKGVPPQSGQVSAFDDSTVVTPHAFDIKNVLGLRITLTARSPKLSRSATNITLRSGITPNAFGPSFNYRPESEDFKYDGVTNYGSWAPSNRGNVRTDGYDHYKMTATVMLRNRMLGY